MTGTQKWAAYFRADVTGTRVMRCQGTSRYRETPDLAREDGDKDGRPFVVADQHGVIEP